MKDIVIDMWYGNRRQDVEMLDCSWSDCDCVYRGNLFLNGKMVGDYTAKTIEAIQKAFGHLSFA